MCSYCSMSWYRSACVRDATGYLACPDCQDGKDLATLDRERAEAIAELAAEHTPSGSERW